MSAAILSTPHCCAAHYSTPPRFSADSSSAPGPSYDSPMLTPSPLRQRAFSPPVHDPEQDDIFLQSPFNSPPPVHCLYPQRTASTPLSISAANTDPASGVAFHHLAPLPAPQFGIHTPLTQSKAETEAHLKGQAETMKRMHIRDMENSDEDWGVIEDDDSAYEVEEQNSVPTKKPLLNKLPLLSRWSKNQLCSPRKPLTIKAVPQKGSALDEVTEAISPGGHILERQACSRPLFLELLESINQTLSPSASSHRDPTSMVSNRHSYTGSGAEAIATFPWRSSLNIPSPDSSPVSVPHGSHDDEDDMFFEPCGPLETSFVFSVMEGTPSPRLKGQKGKDMLPLKYKPRDSGVALSDDEGDASNSLSAMPQASTSSSLNSDIGDDLITLGAIPGLDSGWPPAFVISGLDDDNRIDRVDVDAFILRMLAAGGKPSTEEPKKPPGTPVKKLKIGFNFGGLDLGVVPGGKMKNRPRKSLPAAFPLLGFKKGADLQGSDEDEDEMNSPSTRKEASKYEGLGLGRPPVLCGPAGPVERTRWLMWRSSSGAFSSGSEASLATPTRRSKDWPILPRVPTHISPTAAAQLHIHSEKPAPGLTSQQLPISPLQHIAPMWQIREVLKVRSKNGPSNSILAVKRSKPFEGPDTGMDLNPFNVRTIYSSTPNYYTSVVNASGFNSILSFWSLHNTADVYNTSSGLMSC
ncbi:hypothetical protein EV363DRAFT_1452302 [Boletus edulis]|nr:hypothetical protein EV363DRAFT_1452302 [Boletus edulis]